VGAGQQAPCCDRGRVGAPHHREGRAGRGVGTPPIPGVVSRGGSGRRGWGDRFHLSHHRRARLLHMFRSGAERAAALLARSARDGGRHKARESGGRVKGTPLLFSISPRTKKFRLSESPSLARSSMCATHDTIGAGRSCRRNPPSRGLKRAGGEKMGSCRSMAGLGGSQVCGAGRRHGPPTGTRRSSISCPCRRVAA